MALNLGGKFIQSPSTNILRSLLSQLASSILALFCIKILYPLIYQLINNWVKPYPLVLSVEETLLHFIIRKSFKKTSKPQPPRLGPLIKLLHHHPWHKTKISCLPPSSSRGPIPQSSLTLPSSFLLTSSQPHFPQILSSKTWFFKMAISLSLSTPISSSLLPRPYPSRTHLISPTLFSPTKSSMLISPSLPRTKPTLIHRGATLCLPSVISVSL